MYSSPDGLYTIKGTITVNLTHFNMSCRVQLPNKRGENGEVPWYEPWQWILVGGLVGVGGILLTVWVHGMCKHQVDKCKSKQKRGGADSMGPCSEKESLQSTTSV